MSPWNYYAQWFKTAVHEWYAWVSAVVLLIALGGPLLSVAWAPDWTPLLWLIAALAAFLAVLRAPYVMYVRLERDRDELQRRVREFDAARPDLVITPCRDGTYALLRVKNRGGAGNVGAIATLERDGTTDGVPWPLRWRGSDSKLMKLNRGDRRLLDVASDPSPGGQHDETDPKLDFYSAALTTADGKKMTSLRKSVSLSRTRLDVTVTADPEPRSPVNPRNMLKLDGRGVS